MKGFRNIICGFLFVSLTGCQGGTLNNNVRITLPYYTECNPNLDNYLTRLKASGFKFKHSVQVFHRNYDAHKSIEGVLFLEFDPQVEQDIETVINGIESECFPIAFHQVSDDHLGLRVISNQLHTNSSHGVSSSFVVMHDDKIRLYQPQPK